jgi:hypothetical protein
MAYKSRKARKAGGKAEGPEFQYNAKGSPEEKEEHAKSDEFKRGGAPKKRAHGGHVEGEKSKHHMGKRARGGAMEKKEEREERARGGGVGRRTHGGAMRMGGSPFSSAHSTTAPGNQKGSPGEQAPGSG